MALLTSREGFSLFLSRIDEGAAGNARRGQGQGLVAVLHVGSALGGEEFESGGVDEGSVGGVWSHERDCVV